METTLSVGRAQRVSVPSSEAAYQDALRDFETLVQYAAKLSGETSGRPVTDWPIGEASHIFAKLVLHSIAVRRLAPSGLVAHPGQSECWDVSSICVLARALVDAYSALHYVAVDPVAKPERTFRRRLWNFHSELRRLEMLRLIRSKRPEMLELQAEVRALEKELTADAYYNSLDSGVRSKARKGDLALHLTNSQIAERAGIQPEYYKALYRYLSNYTHTYGLSVAQLALFRSGDPGSLHLIRVALEYSTAYLALAIRDFTKVIPDPPQQPAPVSDLIAKWEYLVANTVNASSETDA